MNNVRQTEKHRPAGPILKKTCLTSCRKLVAQIEKTKDAMSPVVKIVPGDKGREAEVVVEGLPPGVGVRISPERVKIAPVK